MRNDMFKLLVERPRWGAGHAQAAKLKRTYDQDLKYIGLKRHAGIASPYTKSLNENFAPLIRFLRSRRGQSWDSIFSEICAGLDTGSTVKMHVRQHIEDFVLTRICWKGMTGFHPPCCYVLTVKVQSTLQRRGSARSCGQVTAPSVRITGDETGLWASPWRHDPKP